MDPPICDCLAVPLFSGQIALPAPPSTKVAEEPNSWVHYISAGKGQTMFDNKPPLWTDLACLNRIVLLCLLLVTLPWVLYLVLVPLDPAAHGFDVIWRQFGSWGLGIAWVSIFVLHGLLWLFRRRQ
jgi:hypothetical protein